jgi:LDH2 family malate/lactate/ureidoglycolate dehydrogenase
MPIGGFKGTGLALIMGILSSMLSGASYGTELGNMEDGPKAGADGHFVATIRISAFEDLDLFKSRVDQAVEQIHKCRPAEGTDRIFAPGERESLNREAYLREGIPVNSVTLSDLKQAAEGLGEDVGQFDWL